MKQTIQPDASHAKKATEPTRSQPTQQYATASGGHLAQLSRMVNGSPRVQALTQMKEDIQRSGRVQSLQRLSAAQLSESVRSPLAAVEAAQLKIGIAGTLAHGDRVAGQDNAMEEHGSSAGESPSSSPCGCSSKQGAAEAKQEKRPAQKKSDGEERTAPVQLEEKPAPAPNRTGLPDRLKAGVENLTGISLENVKVHYNSAKPAQLNALAYAQGTDIHVASGQEKHLPHEAWHIVQQKEGRVRPTMQLKAGVPVNDDAGLEHEADAMGTKALQQSAQAQGPHSWHEFRNSSGPMQRLIVNVGDEALRAELAKPTGWIVASDIDVALQQGGEDQDIVELSEVAGTQFDSEENIYLVGHGSPGLLGSELPVRVARELNKIVPREYKGSITSLSCSAGVGETGKAKGSGVSRLATNLRNKKKSGVSVKGLSGIALNHPAYEGGGRAIKSEAIYEKYVEPEINKEIESVNEDWAAYVKKNGLADLKKAALMATALSMQFYEKLERRVRHYLLPKEEDTTTVKS